MKPNRVDHVGIAVNNLDEAIKFYEALGLTCTNIEVVDEQQVKVAFFPCGDADLELLESTTPDGPVAKYIEKNGGRGGIQHIALNVTDIKEAIEYMKSIGMRMIDNEPRYGAGNSSIAFVHPKCTGGVLIELAQRL